ncbi:hypothetical protein B0H11DRAFT_168301 [Mycena galericulata]|nr:hypothetical protein B0H11DRAFT_168301 [Mycena galericulata]
MGGIRREEGVGGKEGGRKRAGEVVRVGGEEMGGGDLRVSMDCIVGEGPGRCRVDLGVRDECIVGRSERTGRTAEGGERRASGSEDRHKKPSRCCPCPRTPARVQRRSGFVKYMRKSRSYRRLDTRSGNERPRLWNAGGGVGVGWRRGGLGWCGGEGEGGPGCERKFTARFRR